MVKRIKKDDDDIGILYSKVSDLSSNQKLSSSKIEDIKNTVLDLSNDFKDVIKVVNELSNKEIISYQSIINRIITIGILISMIIGGNVFITKSIMAQTMYEMKSSISLDHARIIRMEQRLKIEPFGEIKWNRNQE